MAVQQQKIRVLTSAERAQEARKFRLPNPGDVMISLVFVWAFFCFFLVTAGERLLLRIARLATTPELRNAIVASDETALTFIMIVGCIGLIGLVLVCYRYKKLVTCALLFGLTFGSSTWAPVHDVAFGIKYLSIVFMAAFGGLFLYKNFWRLVDTPYYRLFFFYFVWIAFIQFALGGKINDYWYVGTDLSLIFGFAIAYLYFIDNTDSLYELNKALAWTAILILCVHAVAPVVSNDYLQNGRFQSLFNRATGFAVYFSPAVVFMFWMGMNEERNLFRQLFVGAAIAGLVLVLWSGTRSAMLGIVVAVFVLWWVFRTRIFVYIFLAATLGLVAQIVGTSGEEDFQRLVDRLQDGGDDIESGSGRFEIWASYIEVIVRSPIYGYSVSGVKGQFVSAGLQNFYDNVGLNIRVSAPHNAYLGMMSRFGFIGLVLLLVPVFIALRRARNVLLAPDIPAYDKRAYVLPVATIVVVCITAFFEDTLGSNGKGTVSAFLLFPALLICEVHGRRLLEQYGEKPSIQGGLTKTSPGQPSTAEKV